ncbi:MAG: hypothetical protein AMXMBFR47_02920 [Planctomycetota bacterium]
MSPQGCPIPHSHDKLTEAYYFACRAADEYHMPITFRYNVNACLTALRSTRDYLPQEGKAISGFKPWWKEEKRKLEDDPILKLLTDARNVVVHRETLSPKSTASVGMFRGREFKLGLNVDLDPFEPSRSIFKRVVPLMTGVFVDNAHAAIGEELGIQRVWIADLLGDKEVIATLFDALSRVERGIIHVHNLAGDASATPVIKPPRAGDYAVMLETDVDPGLPKKWGWTD